MYGGKRFGGWWSQRCVAAWAATSELLLPPRCLACSGDLARPEAAEGCCRPCREALLREGPSGCPRCGAPGAGPAERLCGDCQRRAPAYDRVWALGPHDGLLRDLVLRAKSDASELVVAGLARLWWSRWGAAWSQTAVDVVACVPSHPWRRWRRGADAPRALAESLASLAGVPAAPGLLRMRRNVRPQKELSRAGRIANVRGGMALAAGYALPSAHVVLVDDVLTTGPTCHEAARVLKRAGAAEVTVAVLARAAEAASPPRSIL
jgi:predicted amidophosphoribosyltransferase